MDFGSLLGQFGSVVENAQQHSGNSGESSIFENALGHLQNNQSNIQNSDVDEQQAIEAHQRVENNDGSQQHDANSLGMAAGVNALKHLSGGGGGTPDLSQLSSLMSGFTGGGGSGQGQNAFVSMAMGQASKMFDQQSAQGNVVS
jgi:hypothetical protein